MADYITKNRREEMTKNNLIIGKKGVRWLFNNLFNPLKKH